MRLSSRSFLLAPLACGLVFLQPVAAHAQVVYSDTFNSGASQGTASAYFSDASQNNGLVVKSENIYGTNGISADVEGSGYFLFQGTSNQSVPTGQNAVYISPTFAVTPNRAYNVSFFLTNDNLGAVAQIQAVVNGNALGAAVSAAGNYSSNGWQQFNFTFNSGAATSATLTLNDLQTTFSGNDFGLDNIRVAAVPEPGSLALLVGMGASSAGFLIRRRKSAHKGA